MKIRLDHNVLAEAIAWTARSVPVRPPSPVLAGVRLEASDEVLTLSSFNYEVSARSQVPAQVEIPGKVLVSGRLLADIAKWLPNQPVEIEVEGAKVNVSCGSARFTLAAMADDEYPELPAMPATAGTVEAQNFAEAVSQVTSAASRNDTLPILTSVEIKIDGNEILFMATDRYRLAVRKINWNPRNEEITKTVLINAKILSDVAKTTSNSGSINLAFDEDNSTGSSIIGFEANGRQTTSLLTDGDYPPVLKLFPEETLIKAIVKREELISAIKRVRLVADRTTQVQLSFSEAGLVLDAGNGEDANASEQLDAVLQGEDINTAFNHDYLLEGITAIKHPYVVFSFTQQAKPVVLTGAESLDSEPDLSFRYLLMPIRYGA